MSCGVCWECNVECVGNVMWSVLGMRCEVYWECNGECVGNVAWNVLVE